MTRPGDARWSALTEPLLERPGVTRSTMMGFPCLRLDGDFFASWDPRNEQLVVKLDQPTAGALVEAGRAEPFAPNGRRFSKWVAVPVARRRSWRRFLDEAFDHAVARRRT